MPFRAQEESGRVILVRHYDDVTHSNRIVCPDCGWPMRFQDETVGRVAFFAHRPRMKGEVARACAWAGMTEEHHTALRTLQNEPPQVFSALAGIAGKEEARLDNGSRRADVLYLGADGRYPVAFEAQFSRIEFGAGGNGRSIEERTQDYHAAGVHVVWCFFEGREWADRMYAACLEYYGVAGRLSTNGSAVAFRGTLDLAAHPLDNHRKRQESRKQQQARRARDRQYMAEQRERMRRRELAALTAGMLEEAERLRLAAEEQERQDREWREQAALRQREYNRVAEILRQEERRRKKEEERERIKHINASLGIDVEIARFTVMPVGSPMAAHHRAYRLVCDGVDTGMNVVQCDHRSNETAHGTHWLVQCAHGYDPMGPHLHVDSALFWAIRLFEVQESRKTHGNP
jgi:hypothetical protein